MGGGGGHVPPAPLLRGPCDMEWTIVNKDGINA